ncbi:MULTISPECIES: heat shock protein transcriptional repressor HspR [Campylobacter]|uniref:MerR family transcriptional regulator n=4 Tax=Campylobacter fetus TaxID=196 RepID=A0A5L4MY74_CAMFE|nr:MULTISPECIES: helix-turn-helix transcriptional regulator [Campylobacter]AGZ81624.1 heat shock transcriptional regulator, MerR family [Campylobacter fetus subsp. testudinum 03-427]OCS22329.1 MerR family transcriptional regulator [Campylobacter fetus subsp. venerealis cfvi97/532]OCS25891.1 MerR family transcriptional regulator [Campylobacter fetus subsp. venerealis cfvB10]OCS29106.1 MerR family transcriptional regulator [Campylobacter fetus subsp. venerealis LMG 6570 = CCUG 33900]OCS40046.1 M
MKSYDEPVYLISVVAKVLSIHPQTLRQYEREGLVEPSRTGGKMRLYSEKDLDRIKMILRLTRDLGVNLAGVDVILRLKTQIEEYENIIDELRLNLEKINSSDTKRSLVKRKNSFDLIFLNDEK